VLDHMLESDGSSLADLERGIDRELRPRSISLLGWSAHLHEQIERSTISVKNVVGYLDGSGPLATESIVLGAHYDHLGYGGMGSLSGLKKPTIHPGADDNGSGTTTIMELARRFGQMPNRLGRRLVFITFSGEDSGWLGSEYYCRHPLISLLQDVAIIH